MQISTEGKIWFQDGVVYFSGIILNLGSVVFDSINYINEAVFNLCAATNDIYFIKHNSFTFNLKLNESLFWKDKIPADRKGLRQLAFDFIDNIRYQSMYQTLYQNGSLKWQIWIETWLLEY